MNDWSVIIRYVVLFEGAIAFGLAAYTLYQYARLWRAGLAGPLPQHITLMAASYLILVAGACGMIAELILFPEIASGATIRDYLELRWYRAPLVGVGLIFGVMGLGRLARYEHDRRKAGAGIARSEVLSLKKEADAIDADHAARLERLEQAALAAAVATAKGLAITAKATKAAAAAVAAVAAAETAEALAAAKTAEAAADAAEVAAATIAEAAEALKRKEG